MLKNKIIFLLICGVLTVGAAYGQGKARFGKICGNPNANCRTQSDLFSPNDIRFEVPRNSTIYESEPFYAVILKSKKIQDFFGGDEACRAVDTKEERLSVQRLFPNNKVFSQRCGYDSLYYTGVADNTVFLAIYAGKTLSQAQNFLNVVNRTGKFKGAFVKKLQGQFNGT